MLCSSRHPGPLCCESAMPRLAPQYFPEEAPGPTNRHCERRNAKACLLSMSDPWNLTLATVHSWCLSPLGTIPLMSLAVGSAP